MDEQLEKRLQFLRQANTNGTRHGDRVLLDHLSGTGRLLVEWQAPPARRDAGLFSLVDGRTTSGSPLYWRQRNE